jgi:glycosyltransferase involved in cell wall biosynthesis
VHWQSKMNNSSEKITIAIVTPNLKRGGAEKVLVHFANNINFEIYNLVIFCQHNEGELLSEIRPEVQIVSLNAPRVYFIFFPLRRALKKYKPDVLIGWMGHINAMLAFLKPFLPSGVVFMCRESSIPSHFIKHYTAPWLFRFLYRFLNRYDGIICQSAAMKADLVNNFKVKESRIKTIHNPVVMKQGPVLPAAISVFLKDAEKTLLYVGRFSEEKRAALTLEVLDILPNSYKLIMVGYGPLENEIRSTINQKGLSERVMIVTDCNNPAAFYERADCLLLTSAFEGFPNVLLEANAMGCPVCVYQTEGGAAEIINNTNGIYIAPDSTTGIVDFCQAIEKICTNPAGYSRPHIAKYTVEKFGIREIIKQYTGFIEAVRTDCVEN